MVYFNEIEKKRIKNDISIARLCRIADLGYSTYLRNKTGQTSPNTKTINKFSKAIEKIRFQRIKANGIKR